MGEFDDAAKSELTLGRLGAALPYIVYVFNVIDRSTVYLNRDLATELGYTPEEAAALGPDRLGALLHDDDRAALAGLFARWDGVADGDFLETEYRLRDPSGDYRWFLGRDTLLERDGDGRPRLLLGTALDITERKSLEVRLQLSQKLEALGRLASGIAHDFNNIITAVLGNAELAQAQLEDRPWVSECLDQIRSAAEQAASLTRSLLGFARPQAIRPELVDVNVCVGEVERLLRRLLGESIRVELALGAGVGAVRIDRAQLTQIVLNLAVNARDAMPRGGVLRIDTRVGRSGEELVGVDGLADGDHVVLEVSDDGVGMDLATKRRIFEPFFTTKAEQRGSGLGLATVYGIVQQQRGTIRVRSEVDHGATFTVYLPRVSDAPEAPPPRRVEVSAGCGPARALLVEDAAPVGAVLRGALVRQGYDVAFARDGVRAIQWIDAGASAGLDLAIIDLILPGCSGLEVAHHARRRWPDALIFLISGHPCDVEGAELSGLGAHFVAKPFAPEALLEQIHALRDAKRAASG